MARRAHQTDGSAVEREWRGYHPRAAVPRVVLAAALSVGVMVGRWQMQDLSDFAERAGAWVFFVLSACSWLIMLTVAYRLVTYTYRLTDSGLLVDFGPRNPPEPVIAWKDVTTVSHGASWFGRAAGVGWVRVTAGAREVLLKGVRGPKAFADTITARMTNAHP
jgi:hypothetical protein